MPEWQTLSLFIVAATILVVMPGPNAFYIMARSLHKGLSAGVVSSLGVMVGTLVHVSAAALGISALLLSSALTFSLVKYTGAGYLVYLGVKTLRAPEKLSTEVVPGAEGGLRATFAQGIVVNLLNPKTALFITAFLPQFINPARGSVLAQIFILGAILILIGAVSDLSYALLAGKVGNRLLGKTLPLRVGRYLAGGVYLGLGLATALTGGHRK